MIIELCRGDVRVSYVETFRTPLCVENLIHYSIKFRLQLLTTGGAILDRRSFLTSFLFLFFRKTLLANIIDFISGVKMWLQLSKLKSSNFSLKMQPRIFFLVFPPALFQYWLRFSIIGRVLLRYSLKGLLVDFNRSNLICF